MSKFPVISDKWKKRLPKNTAEEQCAAYSALLQNLGESSFDEIKKVLKERTPVKLERGLTPEVVEKLKKRMKKKA